MEKLIDRAIMTTIYTSAATLALIFMSGIYAFTNLPYASLIRSWWV
jgi:hypothetical protein